MQKDQNQIGSNEKGEKKLNMINQFRLNLKLNLQENKVTKLRKRVQTFQQIKLHRFLSSEQEEMTPKKSNEEIKQKRLREFQDLYQMLEKIGEGENGVVKKCKSRFNGKVYAVKIMSLDEEKAYFQRRNFLAIRCLKHPNIVKYKCLHLSHQKDICHLVMEYVPGKSLKRLEINDEKTLQSIFFQIFSALSYMDKKNICHRDIKPQNIIYNKKTDKVTIIDFGTSFKTRDKLGKRQATTPTGTLPYRAPEVFDRQYDNLIDVWAAGITLYEVIEGRNPFSTNQLQKQIIKGEIKFDDKVWEKYSKLLKDLVIRLLKKKSQRLRAQDALSHPWFNRSDVASDSTTSEQQIMPLIKSTKQSCSHFNTSGRTNQTSLRKALNHNFKIIQPPNIEQYNSDEDLGLIDI